MTNFCFPFFFFFIKPGSVLLPLAYFKNNFANVEFLVYGLFLSALWMYHLTAFWPPWFVMWNQLLIILRVPFTPLDKSFLSLPSAFSLYLWTAYLQYISFGDHTTCWLSFRYVNDFLKQIWEVLGHYLFNYYFCPFICLLANWNTHYTDTDMLDNVSVLAGFGHFFLPFHLFLRQDNLNPYFVDF